MDDFQPRIEKLPAKSELSARDKYAKLRQFVIDAKGEWCVVAEQRITTRRERNLLRAKLYHALQRVRGYQKSGIEMTAVTENGLCKIYARFIEANVVKNPEPRTYS